MTIEKRTATGEKHCIDFEEFKPEIEKRAKATYITRQTLKAPGDELSDWLKAEKEVKSRHLLP